MAVVCTQLIPACTLVSGGVVYSMLKDHRGGCSQPVFPGFYDTDVSAHTGGILGHDSGAYDTLRSSGIIQLPSQRTLRDYIHHFQAKVGFSEEVEQQLVSHPDLRDAEEWKRHVILLLDEMHIQEDLVYNKHTGALVGFANLGDITDHLEQFEQSLQGVDSTIACQPSQSPCSLSRLEAFLQS